MEDKKQELMDHIHEIDKCLNEILPIQRMLHALIVLNAQDIPDSIKSEIKETDAKVEIMKNARNMLQDILFIEYKTIVLCDWKEP